MPKFPNKIVIELTPKCNLNCAMCPRHHINEHEGFMTEFLWKKLIDEIFERKPETIILPFWRGEPTLHPQFIKFIEYTLEKKMHIHLSTNGHFVDHSFFSILKRCDFVNFSIHTTTGFYMAKQFTKEVAGNSLITQISFIEGESTTLKYFPILIADKTLSNFDRIRLYNEHTKDGVFGKSRLATKKERSFCPKLLDTLVITFDGRISRCNHIWIPEVCQNLNTTTIEAAWGAPILDSIRINYPDSLCTPCDQWKGITQGEAWHKTAKGITHISYL